MQEYDIYDAEGNVDVDKCQAIADDIAYQEWKDLKYDNPKLYAQICAGKVTGYALNDMRKNHYKQKDKRTKPMLIAPWDKL
ncbi:MAG: hypothetical protein K6E20_04170 [Acholeplasmatales bacterium]|nr:hypothetical protein [Acholeplasmatales bacterium]